MGLWPWADSPSGARPDAQTKDDANASQASPKSDSHLPTEPPPSLSRDEQAYEELKVLFHAIDPTRTEAAAARARQRALAPEPDPVSLPSTPSLFPDTMSCTAAFDNAYYCSSMGGQLNSLYRFGGLRSCSEQWGQWRFCMRTRAMGEEERRKKIREWYMERAAKYRTTKSSEDVWKVRKEMVEGAMMKGFDEEETAY